MGDEYSDNEYLDNMYLDDEYDDEYLENEYLEDEYLKEMILECEDTNMERLESNNMDGLNSNEASPQPSISVHINKHHLVKKRKNKLKNQYQKDGSTSNLWRHIRSKHHISRAMIENGRVKIMSNDNDKCKFSIMAESLQLTIKQVFDNIKKYAFNHPKQKKLDNNIAAFIIENLQPFSVLRSQVFKRIIEGLDIRKYIINNTEISSILFTTDMWTSDNGDLYIGLMLHWNNSNFQIKEIIGNISYLPYPHTAECLSNKIVEILDNLQLKNVTCPEITNLIKKCKDIVSKFSVSPKQKQFLLEAQMEMEDWNKLLTVVCDVSTRWNLTFYLLKRLTVLKPALYKYKLLLVETDNNNLLKNYEEKELSLDDWDKVTGLVKLLYPYEVISKKLSGDQLDMTASYDKIDNEDIFAPSATDFQEYSDQQYSTSREFNSYLLLPKASSETDILQ
ncbi:8388_t:CDS:2 [Cetraspora pellucida]|uniref:8388_t:CDS:1 n=1 Tax=Cetraspora pellucida TaxID=1433469 RepID=A0A9N9HNQ6_9GLOM|nr:8388_t:CDS:2 [Cetraspora pellucida]